MPSLDWSKFEAQEEGVTLLAPCVSLTLYLESVDEEGLLDFHQQATAVLGNRLTHYDTGSGKPRKLDARGQSIVPSWKGKMNKPFAGLYVDFSGSPRGASAAELMFFISLEPHASPTASVAKKHWETVLKPTFAKHGRVNIMTSAQLRVGIPLDHPLAKDFNELRAWVGGLRLVREGLFISGQCGYGLSYHGGASSSAYTTVAEGLRRLCLQHPGLDFDMTSGLFRLLIYQPPERILHKVRRANWLTLLSSNCVEQTGGRERLEASLVGSSALVHALGGGALMIQAASAPRVGDPATGDLLPEYQHVARAIRPARVDVLSQAPLGVDQEWVQEWLESLERASP
ncbi:MAG: type VI immunity family protein [Hyalangium sp.]|uniref:type VI immunity family protein n=1 Tax=Hyalangium sp. TaxID=2028555 RepID=UPI00389A0630